MTILAEPIEYVEQVRLYSRKPPYYIYSDIKAIGLQEETSLVRDWEL